MSHVEVIAVTAPGFILIGTAGQRVVAGATVDEVSIPMHNMGPAIWTPIALEGLTNQMMHGNGMGTGWEGMYTTSLLDFHSNWRVFFIGLISFVVFVIIALSFMMALDAFGVTSVA